MDKTRFIGTIVGGMIAYSVCQYLRMKDEEKMLKEVDDTINKSTKSLKEQVDRDMELRVNEMFNEMTGLD